jgi:hypothetical protein
VELAVHNVFSVCTALARLRALPTVAFLPRSACLWACLLVRRSTYLLENLVEFFQSGANRLGFTTVHHFTQAGDFRFDLAFDLCRNFVTEVLSSFSANRWCYRRCCVPRSPAAAVRRHALGVLGIF